MIEQHEVTQTGMRQSRKKRADIIRARRILHGEAVGVEEVLELAKRLVRAGSFGYGRRILSKILPNQNGQSTHYLELARLYAWCTSQDQARQGHQALERALATLENAVDLAEMCDPEILNIAGALHKRLWEVGAQKHHLVRSLAYYKRGYEHGDGPQKGYAGIHAAFLLDVLAHSEDREAVQAGTKSESAPPRRIQAQHIRQELTASLPELLNLPEHKKLGHDWRFLVTIAEAFFGLKRYEEASDWLKKVADLGIADKHLEATTRHLSMLARLQDVPTPGATAELSPAWKCLAALVGYDVSALMSAPLGKLGLALSGGGFRAALFHIGVLARLAELDVLRSVEVISCVSGGSIVGAHYYLEVRKLLQAKEDENITKDDYIGIVQRIERDLLAGIQQNIRMQVAADGLAILRVLFDRDYSRTVRAGELYERAIYARIDDDKVRCLRDLKIVPRGARPGFHPRQGNWRRRAKVPILVINATTLNTGHNWQFTTTWMGEPPSGIPREVDSNERLRRLYYNQAPAPHQDISLGKAVAASACVPGIFEPVSLSGLYPKRTVRLVDGGVHDNQGIGGLLDEHCKVILVSDASGQMETLLDPGTNVFTVLSRADSIARVHVRAAQYDGLETRCRTALLHHLMFLHLKKDLDVELVNWIGCEDPEPPSRAKEDARAGYGIPKKIQESLASVRTDLDSFCDQEAYALMLSGYRMTKHEFPRRVENIPTEATRENWRFLALGPALIEKVEPGHGQLHRLLDVARFISFKIWRLTPGLFAAFLLLAGLIPGVLWLLGRENGLLAGTMPIAAAVAAFCCFYALTRIVIRRQWSLPTPFPEILGFLLYAAMLLVLVDVLWYSRQLWLWWTGYEVGTGAWSWILAALSAFAGLLVVLLATFVFVYLLTILLRSKKSWSEVAIGLGFLFFLPLANLHLLTYDRWYLWHGRL
jgi:predicted acylesterase/phospholipase RssA